MKKTLFVQETCNGGCTPAMGFPCPYPGCPRGMNTAELQIPVRDQEGNVVRVHSGPDRFDFDYPIFKTDVYRREWKTVILETCELQYLAWEKIK